jgi:hypothetical protein
MLSKFETATPGNLRYSLMGKNLRGKKEAAAARTHQWQIQ